MNLRNTALVGTQVRGVKGWTQELTGSLGYSESGGQASKVCPGLFGVLAVKSH